MAARAVAGADAVLVRAVADQAKVNPAALREAIPGGMAEPMQTSHLGAMVILHLGVMQISHHAMMPILSRAMTRNPTTTLRAISAPAPHKSATVQAAAVMGAAAAAWAVNAAKRLAHPPKAVSQTRCAPALT